LLRTPPQTFGTIAIDYAGRRYLTTNTSPSRVHLRNANAISKSGNPHESTLPIAATGALSLPGISAITKHNDGNLA
jgi:hypothetical protein